MRLSRKFGLLIFLSIIFLGANNGLIFVSKVYAAEIIIKPVGGVDATSNTPRALTSSEISALSDSDNIRIQSDGDSWPKDTAFDESKYLEFIFSPIVPNGLEIDKVIITHELRRSGALTAAKLEIWDGDSFVNFPVSVGSSTNTDFSQNVDVTNVLESAEKINNTKIRFLAYRTVSTADTKTSHDLINIIVTYRASAPGSDPAGEPSPVASLFSDLNQNGVLDHQEENITITSNTFLPAGEYNFNNLTISGNAILTLRGDEFTEASFRGVKINAENITIESGATISADRQGYFTGPGAPLAGTQGGASYGGVGEQNGSRTPKYGSAVRPTDLGSGKGAGYNRGGGAIWLVINDTLQNNGKVSANGDRSSSGGSIYVTTKNMSGSGIFQTNGGAHYLTAVTNGSGGGGRVALYYETSSFIGTTEALGGCGSYDGFSMRCAQSGTVGFFDTINNNLLVDSSWEFRANDNPMIFNNVFITNKAKVTTEENADITANNISVDGASTFTLTGEEAMPVSSLILKGSSTLTVLPERILYLEIPNIIIETGSRISANMTGYFFGPGAPDIPNGAGASYGGKGGGALAKPTYGSDVAPVDLCSGSGSRRGGGALRILARENLQNDGSISANAVDIIGYERASGGSVYITAGKLSGSGTFQANGGNGSWPYINLAGGGGRIAIYFTENFFAGTVTAKGGVYCYSGCKQVAENGTVVIGQSFLRNPVIIIPGVLGTEIFNGAEKLWQDVSRTLASLSDEFLDDLAFSSDLLPINNNLTPGNVIGKILNFDYSDNLIIEFQNQGYEKDINLFTFPYDWLYGVNTINVESLKQKIMDILTQTGKNKIDIIAHSTGGLLVKKYVMENSTEHHIDKAIFIGVPNTGAPKAIKALVAGDSFGNPFLSQNEMKKIAKNLPVVYDLLPSRGYYAQKG